MSKLRQAVSKKHLRRLGQDVLPAPKLLGRILPRGSRRRARAAEPSPVGVPANDNTGVPKNEPEAIRQARASLRLMVVEATKGAPRSSVGIVLAIVNQETGNHVAANALIDEYELDRLFGLQKFTKIS